MNAETNELLRRLEQATSAGPVDPNMLDEETAMLRENWLALGKLLRAAESEPQRIEVVEFRRSAPQRRKSWRLAWACAASALAVAGLWFVFRTTQFHDSGHQGGRNQVVNRSESDDRTNFVPSPVKPPISALAWEDDWDNDLAQTALALQQFHGEPRVRDSSLSRLQGKFQELAREFEFGSL